jgi:flagellar biosynthesis protein FlhB
MILKEFNDPFYYHIETKTEKKKEKRKSKERAKKEQRKSKEFQDVITFMKYCSFYTFDFCADQ